MVHHGRSVQALAIDCDLPTSFLKVHAPEKIAEFGAWAAAHDKNLVKLLKDGALKPSNWDATEGRINDEKLKPEGERDMFKQAVRLSLQSFVVRSNRLCAEPTAGSYWLKSTVTPGTHI